MNQRLVRFDLIAFLSTAGIGKKLLNLRSKQTVFSQGSQADAVFYLQKGRVKVTVVSRLGKEATITLLSTGDFLGEDAVAALPGKRLCSAVAVTACNIVRIERSEVLRVLHEEQEFSDMFLAFVLARSMRTQADLVDQLFNSSEKRLARILLLMAEVGNDSPQEVVLPRISQETLADMVGTTRSRVSFFMNRFRKLGYIQYNGEIRVKKSLLNIVLHDQGLLENVSSPTLSRTSRSGKDGPEELTLTKL